MKKVLFFALALVAVMETAATAQVYDQYGNAVDTTAIYGTQTDSIAATVFVATQRGTSISRLKDLRVEAISQAGICKLACCNLAESFENSASVTVGYSDATTGARQIRLLGLSGIYTQMLDENRPVMRGLAAPFGMNYVPGAWLESIQIAKGASSVINGGESLTGSINVEHRKPTDEIPLYINFATMADTKTDFNISSSLQLNDDWSTVVLGHVSGNFMSMDENGDTFIDEPEQLQFNLANRWLYYSDSGVELRFGVKAVNDVRKGGQRDHDSHVENPWTTDLRNKSLDAFFKLGIPFSADRSTSLAVIGDWSLQGMDSMFGLTDYDATQNSGFLNVIFQHELDEKNRYTLGASAVLDSYEETLAARRTDTRLANGGIYGEYTFKNEDKFSLIAALRGDLYSGEGLKVIPRLTMRWAPAESFVLRANGGRGLRFSTPVIDNIGILSTGKRYEGTFDVHTLEDAWTFGANASYYFPFFGSYISADWFRTSFAEQKVVEYGAEDIRFFDLSSLDGGKSYTDNWQLDWYIEPAKRFNITATFRYTDARVTLSDGKLRYRPMTSKYKGVLNMQYALPLNKWIFDFTASVNGPCEKWEFMGGGETPVYPLFYAQVTKRFKGVDIYVGGENLAGYRQKDIVIGTPWASDFDASQVWGPIMGAKIYAGLRFTLWKKA